MDPEKMADTVQGLREWRAATEPRIDRIEKKTDDHSGKLQNINIELAELRTDFNAFAREIKGIVVNVKWWIMAAIALAGAMAKWL